MQDKIRVGLIFGGKSSEHEVSLASARSVLHALDPDKYIVIQIGITKGGQWLIGGDSLTQLIKATTSPLLQSDNGSSENKSNDKAIVFQSATELTIQNDFGGNVDVIFPLLHGPNGEDGTVQGLFELSGLPYVGAGVAASAIGMDKALMKAVFHSAGLPLTDYLVIMRHAWDTFPEETIREIESVLGYPCFVKPANLGSSVGITKAHNWDELTQGLVTAAKHDRKLIVERALDAREIECSVLGNDEPIASLPGEIIPRREFYDYEAKYADDQTALIVPADLTDEQTGAIQDLAIRAFKAIDCSGMARVDFFLGKKNGRLVVNEINTIPGFTPVSMYPRMWQASGMTYPQLLDRLIDLALERRDDSVRVKS